MMPQACPLARSTCFRSGSAAAVEIADVLQATSRILPPRMSQRLFEEQFRVVRGRTAHLDARRRAFRRPGIPYRQDPQLLPAVGAATDARSQPGAWLVKLRPYQ